MSSNFATRKIDWSLYGVVFAGAHKNIGPAGVTITIVREDLLGEYEQEDITNMLSWNTCAKAVKHLYNTPCSWSIYMCGLSIAYMLEKGMDTIEKEAIAKAELFYSYIDSTEGYYSNPVAKEFRSKVNIPFRVKDDADMEKKFVKEARAAGFIELAGHVTVGFCRASIYNAMPIEAIEKLVEFMQKFREENP